MQEDNYLGSFGGDMLEEWTGAIVFAVEYGGADRGFKEWTEWVSQD